VRYRSVIERYRYQVDPIWGSRLRKTHVVNYSRANLVSANN